MSVTLLVMADGRDEYLDVAIQSAADNLHGPVVELVLHDDSGDGRYRQRLRERFPDFRVIGDGPRRGFAGAIAHAWRYLSTHQTTDWVFHLEQDFIFTGPVPLRDMISVMEGNPHLVQMALRRQPWNDQERAAGGIVELHPDSYEARQDEQGRHWLEHRRFFTTNPSLYPRSLTIRGWPDVRRSEGRFGIDLFGSDHRKRSGYWGARDSGIWCEHIGHTRRGRGY